MYIIHDFGNTMIHEILKFPVFSNYTMSDIPSLFPRNFSVKNTSRMYVLSRSYSVLSGDSYHFFDHTDVFLQTLDLLLSVNVEGIKGIHLVLRNVYCSRVIVTD